MSADERAAFCEWLVGTYGGAGQQHRCLFDGQPIFDLTIRTVSQCEDALARGFLAGCPSGNCSVSLVEQRVAAGGSSSLCGPWMGVWSCDPRALFGIVAGCRGLSSAGDDWCEPACEL